jgi:prepilin-type N-terminal cleavage/methylation domain-containing protein
MKRFSIYQTERGFTLAEMVFVVVIMGIIGSVGGLAIMDAHKETQLAGAANRVLSDIRYAQEAAMARNTQVNVYFGGYWYAAAYNGGDGYVQSPVTGGSLFVDLREYFGASISCNTFSFSKEGVPSSSRTITVYRGGKSKHIHVTANTGYAYINN